MDPVTRGMIVDCLKELSDKTVQETLWKAKVPGKQSDFVETVERLFSDSGLGDALLSHSTGFSTHIESLLRSLDVNLKSVRDRHTDTANDPAMPLVREVAAKILSLIETTRS